MQKADIWTSGNSQDYKTGVLRVGPIDAMIIESIVLPIFTGPVTTNQKLTLVAQDGIHTLDIIDVPVSTGTWSYYKIKVTPFPDLPAGTAIYLDFHDNGDQFGEWFAIALPKLKQ